MQAMNACRKMTGETNWKWTCTKVIGTSGYATHSVCIQLVCSQVSRVRLWVWPADELKWYQDSMASYFVTYTYDTIAIPSAYLHDTALKGIRRSLQSTFRIPGEHVLNSQYWILLLNISYNVGKGIFFFDTVIFKTKKYTKNNLMQPGEFKVLKLALGCRR